MPETIRQPRAEALLKEVGAFARSTRSQDAVLGCLACRWNKNPEQVIDEMPHGKQIAQCNNIESGTVYSILERILRGGVMIKRRESINTTAAERPARQYYLPSNSQRSADFLESLNIPSSCGLEQSTPADGENSTKREVLAILTDGSDDVVLWVMRAAAEELATRLNATTAIPTCP